MKFTQFGKLILIIVLTLLLINFGIIFLIEFKKPIVLIVPTVIVVFVLLLFYKLDIFIENQQIKLSFGLGVIKKTINISSIQSVDIVRNSPASGLGIRENKNYTLYNVGGLDAIELSFKDNSKKIRIGTNKPQEVSSYLSKML